MWIHNFDAESFFRESHRALKAEGLLICQFLNRYGYKGVVKSLGGYVAQNLGYMSYAQFVATMRRSDFAIEQARGYNWLPCRRLSNKRFVKVLAWAEQRLHLDRFPHLSPWCLVAARKQSTGTSTRSG
jgi:hypothetical protein